MAKKNKTEETVAPSPITVDSNTLLVSPSLILADESWNSRSGNWELPGDGKTLTAYEELEASIKETGAVLTPLDVRPTTDDEKASTGKEFFLITGFRRFRAASKLELATIPVHVGEYTASAARLRNLQENCLREQLNTPDLAFAIAELGDGVTQTEIARKCGITQTYVGKLQKITKSLDKKVFDAWRRATFKVSIGDITAISELPRIEQLSKFAALAQALAKKGGVGRRPWIEAAQKRASNLGYTVGQLVRKNLVGQVETTADMWDREDCVILAPIPEKANPAEKEAIIAAFCAAVQCGVAGQSAEEISESTIDNPPIAP